MKTFLIWTLVGICGLGLIFDGSIRNDYYTSFSYLFPANTKQNQDLADATRLIIGLAMMLSIFNFCGGLLLKLLSVIGFVIYSVVINQDFLLNPSASKLKQITSIAVQITLLFACMDSIIGHIIREQTQADRERTKKAIVNAKKQAEKVPQQSQKPQKEKANPSSGKNKGNQQAKQDKKEVKGSQKQKKH